MLKAAAAVAATIYGGSRVLMYWTGTPSQSQSLALAPLWLPLFLLLPRLVMTPGPYPPPPKATATFLETGIRIVPAKDIRKIKVYVTALSNAILAECKATGPVPVLQVWNQNSGGGRY